MTNGFSGFGRLIAAVIILLGILTAGAYADGPVLKSNVVIALTVGKGASPAKSARLTALAREGTGKLHIDISTHSIRMQLEKDDSTEGLKAIPYQLTAGLHQLTIKKRGPEVVLCIDMDRIRAINFDLPVRPRIALTSTEGLGLNPQIHIQEIRPIRFSDDFAREQLPGPAWEILSGRFAQGIKLASRHAQNPFELSAAAEKRGLALARASQWFWDDYRFDVSVKVTRYTAGAGIVFYHRDADNYHLLVWARGPDQQGRLTLVQRRRGQELVLAAADAPLQPEQWHRLAAVASGSMIKGFVNGRLVLQAESRAMAGGRAGLALEESEGVYFDDALALSVGSEARGKEFNLTGPLGPGEKEWIDFTGKQFTDDQDMVLWSRGRSFWQPPQKGLSWFRTRLFHDAVFRWRRDLQKTSSHWPGKPVRVIMFGDPADTGAGLQFKLEGKRASLKYGADALARAEIAEKEIKSLECRVSPAGCSMIVNGALVLSGPAPESVKSGWVGADLGPMGGTSLRRRDWRDEARITSTHRLDYGFDSAPVAWEAQTGEWKSVHRWACDPKWSFFGGLGNKIDGENNRDSAILWNRRLVKGDFEFEVFLAPMEGTPQRVHFAWPMVLNLSFGCGERDLDTGYSLVYGLMDMPLALYRRGVKVAEWNKMLDPAMRRAKGWELYRRVTRTWQHLRVSRTGGRIRIDLGKHDSYGRYRGLNRVIEYDDPEPLTGGMTGLWTWGLNGMAVARAIMSFETSPGIARPSSRRGMDGIEVITEDNGPVKQFTRISNQGSGGIFRYDLAGETALDKAGLLEFDFRPRPGLRLALVALVRGQVCQAILTGPDIFRRSAIPLGRLKVAAAGDGGWQHVSIDLLKALRRVFPEGPLIAERISIESPFESTPEIAGFGLNRHGASYDLAGLHLRAAPVPAPLSPPRIPRIRLRGISPLDDFEHDVGNWERLGGWGGASLYRDPVRPANGNHSLRLLNQEIAGPAGAVITREGYSLGAFPVLSFDYRIPPGVETNLLLNIRGLGWREIVLTGADSTWPRIGQVAPFHADNKWHHAVVDIASILKRRRVPETARIEALAVADSAVMSTWQNLPYWFDNFCRVPALDPQAETVFELSLPGAEVAAYSHVLDSQSETVPPETPTGEGTVLAITKPVKGTFLHVRARDAAGNWSEALHLPVRIMPLGNIPEQAPEKTLPPDPNPPPAPYIAFIPSRRLCRTDFETGRIPWYPEKALGEFRTRRMAWVIPWLRDGATGANCAQIINLAADDFFSAFLRQSEFEPEVYPRIAFDYRFNRAGCALNLSFIVNEAMTIVEWTGANGKGNYFHPAVVGAAPRAIQDGAWHHIDFDFYEMLCRTRFQDPRQRPPVTASEISTWATNHAGRHSAYQNPGNAILKIDNFTIYSPSGRDPSFEWKMHGCTQPMQGFAFVLDKHAQTTPPQEIMTERLHHGFKGIEPGTWYFHVRACNKTGTWGPAAHRKIIITEG